MRENRLGWFLSHQHNLLSFARQLFGLIRAEDNLALRRARTRRQSGRQNGGIGFWIYRRMQKLIELFRCDALDRGRPIDQLFVNHLSGDPHRGCARAFAGARLQHPELAALDRKLAVLHIVIMLLEQIGD